jgi:predicted ATPase/DNA-binding SARP family transcriptional activator
VRLLLFGPPAVATGHDVTALAAERRSQLLAFLALGGGWVARAEIAAMLWPEQPPKLALTNLRKALFRLQSLSGMPPVEAQGNSLRVAVATDVADFEAALRDGDHADAIALYRGDLLQGFDDESSEPWTEWLRFERDRLRASWRAAALARLGGEIEPAAALDITSRLLEADPLDESAMAAQVSWLARGGQGVRARAAYGEFAARLERELGVRPAADVESLVGRAAAPTLAPPPGPAAGPADDAFVGRSVELRRIAEMLTGGGCRLLTLVGPGGVGKTSLARRALRDLEPAFPAGVLFVPLEDDATAEDIARSLLRALGTARAAKGDPLQEAIARLGADARLVAFDNFEQLAGAAQVLGRLLDACPALKLIVTSRVRLAVAAEWTLTVEGLPCPEHEDEDRLEAFDAARLFVAAARKVAPSLSPAREAAAIVDICRLVGGMPLALRLAAAWTRVLSCGDIARELEHGTELLRATDPSLPARHASFEEVFDRSWQLLGEREREALARLSVFRGGFTAEAARTVAGAGLPVLGALVDKSLVRREGARMQLHPLVQQLAALRLGEGAEAQAAHAAYFHHFLAHREDSVSRGEGGALGEIDAEFENVRRAWQFSVASGRGALLRRDARTLNDYCGHRARLGEGLALLRQALASAEIGAEAGTRAVLLAFAASLESRQDRYAEAEAAATEGLAAARAARDEATQKKCLSVLATCTMRLGRLAESRAHYKRALALAVDSRRPHEEAGLLDNLSTLEKRLGHLDEALRLGIEALAQYRRAGDSGGVALCLNNLGSLCIQRGELDAALAYLQEADGLCERGGLAGTHALVLANLAGLVLLRDELAPARAYAERSLQIAEPGGLRFLACWLTARLARIACRQGRVEEARERLAAGASLALALGTTSPKVSVVAAFAEMLATAGEAAAARAAVALGLAIPSLNEADRKELDLVAAGLPDPGGKRRATPKLPLDELLQRLVSEAGTGHAALVAALRGRS